MVNSVAFSKIGRFLASGGQDAKLIVWNADTGEMLCEIDTDGPVLCVSWDGRLSRALYYGTTRGCAVRVLDYMARP